MYISCQKYLLTFCLLPKGILKPYLDCCSIVWGNAVINPNINTKHTSLFYHVHAFEYDISWNRWLILLQVLNCDIPCATSYWDNNLRLFSFSRACNNINNFNEHSLYMLLNNTISLLCFEFVYTIFMQTNPKRRQTLNWNKHLFFKSLFWGSS